MGRLPFANETPTNILTALHKGRNPENAIFSSQNFADPEVLEAERRKTNIAAAREQVENQQELIESLSAKVDSTQKQIDGKKRTDTQAYTDLKNSLAYTNRRLSNAQADLEARQKRLTDLENGAVEKRSQRAEALESALKLFNQKIDPIQYFETAGRNYNHMVATTLRGLYLTNGVPMGGSLALDEFNKVTSTKQYWKQPHSIFLTGTFPVRVFENLGAWRSGNLPSDRALNYLEGERLRNTYTAIGASMTSVPAFLAR